MLDHLHRVFLSCFFSVIDSQTCIFSYASVVCLQMACSTPALCCQMCMVCSNSVLTTTEWDTHGCLAQHRSDQCFLSSMITEAKQQIQWCSYNEHFHGHFLSKLCRRKKTKIVDIIFLVLLQVQSYFKHQIKVQNLF